MGCTDLECLTNHSFHSIFRNRKASISEAGELPLPANLAASSQKRIFAYKNQESNQKTPAVFHSAISYMKIHSHPAMCSLHLFLLMGA